MYFSKELKERRRKADLSLREAEERTSGILSFSMIHRYENGVGLDVMSIRHARAISKLFKWNVSDIEKKIAAEVAAQGEECSTQT